MSHQLGRIEAELFQRCDMVHRYNVHAREIQALAVNDPFAVAVKPRDLRVLIRSFPEDFNGGGSGAVCQFEKLADDERDAFPYCPNRVGIIHDSRRRSGGGDRRLEFSGLVDAPFHSFLDVCGVLLQEIGDHDTARVIVEEMVRCTLHTEMDLEVAGAVGAPEALLEPPVAGAEEAVDENQSFERYQELPSFTEATSEAIGEKQRALGIIRHQEKDLVDVLVIHGDSPAVAGGAYHRHLYVAEEGMAVVYQRHSHGGVVFDRPHSYMKLVL
nr:hypothetical protein Itr_chr08CG02630 [Ipomoea trifida]